MRSRRKRIAVSARIVRLVSMEHAVPGPKESTHFRSVEAELQEANDKHRRSTSPSEVTRVWSSVKAGTSAQAHAFNDTTGNDIHRNFNRTPDFGSIVRMLRPNVPVR